MSFFFKGHKLSKYAEIVDFALELEGDEQKQFVDEYEKLFGESGLSNIGYWSGYYEPEMMLKIQKVFRTKHPIFGNKVPTDQQAFNAGLVMGKNAKDAAGEPVPE